MRSDRWRDRCSTVLALLGAALLAVSVLAVWTRNQVLDTDRYVETVAPLASDPTVTGALADRVAERVAEELDVRSLAAEVLPEQASVLAGPIAAGADQLIRTAAERALASDEFDDLWAEANRAAHAGLVVVLTGRDGTVLSTSDGVVSLDLGGLAEEVLERVDQRFDIDLAQRIPAERLDVTYELVDSEQLARVQVWVRWLDRLAWLSVVLTSTMFVGALAAGTDRRRAAVVIGLGSATAMLLLTVGFGVGRDLYLSNLPPIVERPDVAAVVFDTLTRLVRQAIWALLAVGLAVAAGAWLVGPGRVATAVRGWWDRVRTAVAADGPSSSVDR